MKARSVEKSRQFIYKKLALRDRYNKTVSSVDQLDIRQLYIYTHDIKN